LTDVEKSVDRQEQSIARQEQSLERQEESIARKAKIAEEEREKRLYDDLP